MHEKHGNENRVFMGGIILTIVGFFFTLHMLLPEAKLLPAALFAAGVMTMAVSHLKKSKNE